jgi:hypothetical protein
MTAAAIFGLPMRAPVVRALLALCLAAAWLASVMCLAPGRASAQARPTGGSRPARPRTAQPEAAPTQPAIPADAPTPPHTASSPASDATAGDDASASAEPNANDADTSGLAVPPPDDTGPDTTTSDSTVRRSDRPRRPRPEAPLHDGVHPADEDDDEYARDRWRIPSDLVNPFLDRQGFATRRRARDTDAESWFITDEDLLDPWEAGAIGPFYSVQCEGRRCRPDSDRPIFLARPRARGLEALHRPRRRRALPSVELAALGSVTTVDDNARARLEAQATVHNGAFGVGLSLSTSTGRTRVDGERLTHTRHAFAAIAQHRLHDGVVALDLGVGAGLMVMGLEETRVAPVARMMATLGVPLVGHASLIFRADALTTFVRPAERATAEGPSAFEFGMGVGLRIATR